MSISQSVYFTVITISDSCAQGTSEDVSGVALIEYLKTVFFKGGATDVVCVGNNGNSIIIPDDATVITDTIISITDGTNNNATTMLTPHLIVTTGGTGFGSRDVTPEAVRLLLQKEAPGVVHAMLSYGLTQTPYAWLSRPVAGVRGTTLIITVPGNAKAAVESMTPLCEAGLLHALELINGDTSKIHPVATDLIQSPRRAPVPVALRPRNSEYPMVPMDKALALIEKECVARMHVGTSNNVCDLLNSTLREPLCSTINMPPFKASIKDGYAVVCSDGVGCYNVADAYTAGTALKEGFVLHSGQVCRVSTGGPVPDGADAVIQVEDTTVESITADGTEETLIRINKQVTSGNDIRPMGCDTAIGSVVLPDGTYMGPAEIALWLSVGAPSLRYTRKPVVAVLSTGNELWSPPYQRNSNYDIAAHLPTGKILDSNRGMLISALRNSGCIQDVIDAGIARDNFAETRAVIHNAWTKADVIIASGGVSMGEMDYVKTALLDIGATIQFGRVSMKPGKPTTFATLGEKVFFALPGNPVSALVCYYVFVVPALRVLRGLSPTLPTVLARLSTDVALDQERPEYHRCRLMRKTGNATLIAESTGWQASHHLPSIAGANGLMVLPAGTADCLNIAAGSDVKVIVIGEIIMSA